VLTINNLTLDMIILALLLDSRPMTSCHVTAVMYLFIVQEIKEIEKKRKRKIKSKKIDKRKIKIKIKYKDSSIL